MKDETTVAFHNTGRRGLLRPVRGLLAPRPESPDLPDRYRVREEAGRALPVCLDAPEIRVVVSRSSSAAAGAARKAPEGTIFLDGAAQSEPFIDTQRRVMNLDHHQGCVRPFTLATCEQALALVLRGLDLREKPWTILRQRRRSRHRPRDLGAAQQHAPRARRSGAASGGAGDPARGRHRRARLRAA